MSEWSTHAHRYTHPPYSPYPHASPHATHAAASAAYVSVPSLSPHSIHSHSPHSPSSFSPRTPQLHAYLAPAHHQQYGHHQPHPQQQQQQQQHPHSTRHRASTQLGLALHHPSPVRAHSYPSQYGYAVNFSTGSVHSSTGSKHNLPSPPLSTSAMPDPWTAERPETDDDEWGVTSGGSPRSMGSAPRNGHASPPRALGLHRSAYSPPMKAAAGPPSKKSFGAPYTLEVWASVMDKSKGRDKVLKTVQYSLRTYLYLLGLIAAVRPLTKWFRANQKRATLAVAGLSLTRKCLLLLNPLRPVGALLSPEPTSAREFLDHLIDLIGAVADDVFCLSKLGLVSRRKGKKADMWANRIWLFSTVTGLYALYAKSFRPRSKEDKTEDEWKQRKLLCDLVFVSYDIFEISWFKEPVLCISGLMAALIGTGQLYHKEWQAMSKQRLQ